jgi:hypothetical protein
MPDLRALMLAFSSLQAESQYCARIRGIRSLHLKSVLWLLVKTPTTASKNSNYGGGFAFTASHWNVSCVGMKETPDHKIAAAPTSQTPLVTPHCIAL